jgi:hypothetical protein
MRIYIIAKGEIPGHTRFVADSPLEEAVHEGGRSSAIRRAPAQDRCKNSGRAQFPESQ